MSSTRPSAKRVRSDQDHSKADTKKREQDLQSDQDDKMDGKGGGDDDDDKKKKKEEEDEQAKKDDDWQSVGPFQIGASWEGWETQWRGSCWCNKSQPLILLLVERASADLRSCFRVLYRPAADQVLPLRGLPATPR